MRDLVRPPARRAARRVDPACGGRRGAGMRRACVAATLAPLALGPLDLRAQESPRGEAIAVEGMAGPYGERLRIDDKGLTLTFPDEAATLRIGGRLHLDFGGASSRGAGPGDPFSDAIVVRRSWIEANLGLGRDLRIGFQYDLADPTTPINDAVIVSRGLAGATVALGNQKEPFSLDQLIANNDLLFTERSLADAFAPARNFGFAVGRRGDAWTAVAGVFGGNANTGIGTEGVAATARVTYAPIRDEARTLHLGLAGSLRSLPRDGAPLSLSSRPEAFLSTRAFVDTGDIGDASRVGRVGLEAAYRDGPLLVTAEYIRTEVERFEGARALRFQGGYVQASLVLNGDNRAYRLAPEFNGTTYAVFGGVRVGEAQRLTRGGTGVFELAARLSAIDLDDGSVRGGAERNATVGLSWYPDTKVRIIADYVRSHAAPSALQGGRAIDADAFIGRFQLYW